MLWVDADAIFQRFDVDVRSVITKDANLYIARHAHPHHSPPSVPNTGVMLFRNCEWSVRLLDELWSMERYVNHHWWENAALIDRMGFYSLLDGRPDSPDLALLQKVAFLSTDWNFIPSVCFDGNPIIRHYAGESNDFRRHELPRDALRACFRAIAEMNPPRRPTTPAGKWRRGWVSRAPRS